MGDDLERRLAKLEARQDVQDERLLQGNARFSALEQNKFGPSFWAKVLVPFVLASGGWVYSIAQIPDRGEVRTMIWDHAPWVRERGPVMRVVENYDNDMERTGHALEEIRNSLTGIKKDLKTALSRRKRR